MGPQTATSMGQASKVPVAIRNQHLGVGSPKWPIDVGVKSTIDVGSSISDTYPTPIVLYFFMLYSCVWLQAD